jgi:nucleoside 2-deoxyribosyltransferase
MSGNGKRVVNREAMDMLSARTRNRNRDPNPYPARTVYLAGPITGLTYGKARHTWRRDFPMLLPDHIHCISPMRGAELMDRAGVIKAGAEYESQHHIENPKGIFTRDIQDVRRCDMVVANFLGAGVPSIGTCVEFGAAYILQKPVVLVMEKGASDNPHLHAFITEVASYWVDSIEDAADIVTTLLTPGV